VTATTIDLDRAVKLFRALADPTRLGILKKLRNGEQCVCDLMAALDAEQSRLSFHLKCLKEAGVLQDRRVGRWIYYGLNPTAIAEIQSAIATLRLGGFD
jgi:ArsR family transcriptional regulator